MWRRYWRPTTRAWTTERDGAGRARRSGPTVHPGDEAARERERCQCPRQQAARGGGTESGPASTALAPPPVVSTPAGTSTRSSAAEFASAMAPETTANRVATPAGQRDRVTTRYSDPPPPPDEPCSGAGGPDPESEPQPANAVPSAVAPLAAKNRRRVGLSIVGVASQSPVRFGEPEGGDAVRRPQERWFEQVRGRL